MTNQERLDLSKAVAKAMGWADCHTFRKRVSGRPPGFVVGRVPIPNWPEDLPACMAPGGPWEWLWRKGCEPRLTTYKGGAICDVFPVDPDSPDEHMREFDVLIDNNTDISKACAQAICHAVLAVAKLEEQDDV